MPSTSFGSYVSSATTPLLPVTATNSVIVWFDASDLTTMFADVDGLIPIRGTHGEVVRRWASKGYLANMYCNANQYYLNTVRYDKSVFSKRPNYGALQFSGESTTRIWSFSIPRPLESAPNGATMLMVLHSAVNHPTPGHFWNTKQDNLWIGIIYQFKFFETWGVASGDKRFTYTDSVLGLKVYFVVADPVANISSLYVNDGSSARQTREYSTFFICRDAWLLGWPMMMPEFRLYDRALSEDERIVLHEEMQRKWGSN